MRGFKSLSEEDQDDRADLVPLIDCVFLVLLFYVIASTFSEDNSVFKVELPKAKETAVRAQEDTVTISVSRTGQFALGDEIVPDDQLWGRLEKRNETKRIKTLIIRGDKGCPYEKIVNALDLAQSLNIAEFSLVVANPN